MQIGFAGLLFLIFLTLKLCGVITWSWVWVTAPLWAGAAIFILFFIFALIYAALRVVFHVPSRFKHNKTKTRGRIF